MPNRRVTLLRYAKTPAGWRRYPVLMGKNGRVRPGWVVRDGEPLHCPTGHYELRHYEGQKVVYTSVGDDAIEALSRRDRLVKRLAARESAQEAGAVLVEEQGRARLSVALEKFVSQAKARGSNEAAEKYALTGKDFLRVSGRVYADEVRADDLYSYWTALREGRASERTISDRTRFLLPILRAAGVDTAKFPKPPRVERRLPVVYSIDELTTLFGYDLKPQHRLLYELMLKTGLRDQEAQHLEWPDLHWRDKTLLVRSNPRFGFKVKDAEERAIPMPDDLLLHLKEWRAKNPKTLLVLGTSSDRPNDKALLPLKRYARSAGLNCKRCDGCQRNGECRRWTLHGFRRTYATTLLRSGVDLRTVQRFMGHSDIESTMRYLTPAVGEAARATIARVNWAV